jgi:methylglyoxal synthase
MKRMRIALIAHDMKKDAIVAFVERHCDFFCNCELVATGTTGRRLNDALDLKVKRVQSGPLGGDVQIGAQLAEGGISAVFFFRDPLSSRPHEADVTALLRLCDVYNVPYATNLAGAELMIKSLKLRSVSYVRRYGVRSPVYLHQTHASQVMEQSV